MDRSYPYSRRLVSRARLRKRMAAVAAAALAGSAVLFALGWEADPISARTQPRALSLPALADATLAGAPGQAAVRRIYPYSVVPGGVSGQVELARVIRTDRVVAAHYASFEVDKARPVVVDKPRAVHVSYRKGDKVYWTAGKVMLAPGETLLTDGRNEMRARCANRISDLPQYPVEDHQPAMEELDHPVELGADEGGQYALGPDGLPVSMTADGAIPRHTGQRFPGRGGSVPGAPGAPGNAAASAALSGSTYASSATDGGAFSTMSLSGSSSSMGSRPRPIAYPQTSSPDTGSGPDPVPVTGSDSVGASSGSTAPSGGATSPVPQPGSELAVATPQPAPSAGSPGVEPQPVPGTTPSSDPAPLPGIELPPVFPPVPGEQAGVPQTGGGTPDEPAPQPLPPTGDGPLFPEPDTVTEPFIPKPELGPAPPPAGIEEPTPAADVAEPGSIWLAGSALAALLGLRRRRPAVLRPESSAPPLPPAAP